MKIEIRKEIRDYILNDVNQSLARLGVSEKVSETRESYVKYTDELVYKFRSPSIRQYPVVFKDLYVTGDMTALSDNDKNALFTTVIVRLEYEWSNFDRGTNGCELGRVWYNVEKELPEKLEPDRVMFYVHKESGLEI